MRFLQSLFAVCAFGAALSAADAPDPKSLLMDSNKALFALGNFKLEQQVNVEMQGNKMTMGIKMMGAAGKFRMDMTPMGISIVSDGQATWFWLAPLNQYMKKPASSSPESFAETMMPGAGSMIGKVKDALKDVKIVREEPVEVGGKKRDCYVIEAAIAKMEIPGQAAVTVSNMRQTMWIDKERKIALKQTSDMEMSINGGAPMTMKQDQSVISLDLAPVIGPDEFKFTPPEGAKQVERLPGMPQ